jgi:predicted CXXCH cytochrome family protein
VWIIAVLVVLLCAAAPAFGYDEPANMPEDHQGSVFVNCTCHRVGPDGGVCTLCHPTHGFMSPSAGKGPHGLYDATTDRCDACHMVHDAEGSDLLPGATVTASCYTCHDGTGGHGVYGAIEARTGIDPAVSGGMHEIDTTNVVPGGDAGTGGSATMAFGGPGGTLGCDDCHSPHDSNTVAPFTQERWRTSFNPIIGRGIKTSKLLRQSPGGVAGVVTAYGAGWCAACHQGRTSGGAVHNHPVEDDTVVGAFVYDSLARLATDDQTGVTVMGSLAGTNRGYLMPYPRTVEQDGHNPICQQCHEDTRQVGALVDAEADAASFSVTATDGVSVTDNPRFQNFPHETENPRLLVETDDDLCLNCHTPANLP